MADYNGIICPVCKKAFCQDDDVVVCPVCGTPHHRECYKNIGHCANLSWHSQNKSFDEEYADTQKENEAQNDEKRVIICPRCQEENSNGEIFCKKCGLPISLNDRVHSANMNGAGGPTFMQGMGGFVKINPDEKLDGVEVWKLSAVVKQNQLRFIPTFKLFSQKKTKINFNFCAFFFSMFYLLYRRVYSWGIWALIAQLILAIPSAILNFTNESLTAMFGAEVDFGLMLNDEQTRLLMILAYIAMALSFVVELLIGLFANYLYYKKCLRLSENIDSETDGSREAFLQTAFKKGGVNNFVVIIIGAAYMLVSYILAFMLQSGLF